MPMSMAEFIESNLEAVLSEWEQFASSLRPAAVPLTAEELRNLAESILQSVVKDMASTQSEQERHRKSLGRAPQLAPDVSEAARGHAGDRLAEGFTLNQLVAEYRALRAGVIRRWRAHLPSVGDQQLEEVTRFNEAMDQSLSTAVDWRSTSGA